MNTTILRLAATVTLGTLVALATATATAEPPLTLEAAAEVVPAPQPEGVPAPPPQSSLPPRAYRQSYDPIRASEDAYRQAEQQRLDAIDRQRGLVGALNAANTAASVYQRGIGIAAAYAPPRVARRWILPYAAAVPPVIARPVPILPSGVYAYSMNFAPTQSYRPLATETQQPIGHEKIWTGPNSYVYRPRYADSQPAAAAPSGVRPATALLPTPADPRTRPGAAATPAAAPLDRGSREPASSGPISGIDRLPPADSAATPTADPTPYSHGPIEF